MKTLPEALITIASSFIDTLTLCDNSASEKLVATELFSDESAVDIGHKQTALQLVRVSLQSTV